MTLTRDINAYERKYVDQSSDEHKREWNAIKSKLEEIISTGKSPHIHSRQQLPVILLATPEIVGLPRNMGNLANIVTTGDGGGLADISAALVAELDKQGLNVHVTLPEYKNIYKEFAELSHSEYEKLRHDISDVSRIHLITDDMFTSAKKVYTTSNQDLKNAIAFMKGINTRILPRLKARNEHVLVHCNDWMTGLIPASAKSMGIKSLMTFHNIFTQYLSPEKLFDMGMNVEPYFENLYLKTHPDNLESFENNFRLNEVDFMTTGLHAADYVNTVSPTFLKEIVNGYFREHGVIPEHMRDVIIARHMYGSATGILNAPVESADPRTDNLIPSKFWYKGNGIPDVAVGKPMNKRVFQDEMGLEANLDAPLFFWPSRVSSPQKGFELVLQAIPEVMHKYPNAQIAVAANGDEKLISKFLKLQESFPGRISYKPFTRALSQTGKAGSDFILMPSLYEPCGTPQVEGPRYGTLPVVRRTGGLADTIDSLSGNGLIGNGFKFDDFNKDGLMYGITEALRYYEKGPEHRDSAQRRIMKESFDRFNIENTAKQYINLYETILRDLDENIRVR